MHECTNSRIHARRYARGSYRLSGHWKREIAMDLSCPRSRPSTMLSLSPSLRCLSTSTARQAVVDLLLWSFSYLLRSINCHDFFFFLYFLIFKFTSTTTSNTKSKPPICTVRTSLFSFFFFFLRFIRVYFFLKKKRSRAKNTHTHLHPFLYPSTFYPIDKLPFLEIWRWPIEIVWE